MARNGSGTYSRAVSSYVFNTVIDQVAVNAEMDDIATALTASLAKDGQTVPTANLPMGGYKLTGLGAGSAAGNSLRYEQLFTTGAVQLLGAMDWVKGANIASATTTNLTTATGNGVHITGTTTITAVTLGTGMLRLVVFDDALTLTHHATNNNLPGAANITTAAGDRAIYWADGTTVYCLGYIKASGKSTINPAVGDITGLGANVATALAVAIGSAGAPVVFDGALGTPSSGDLSNCTGAGIVLQIVEGTPYTTYGNTATAIPNDDTIPQNTEGAEWVTVTITPTSATNRLRIEAEMPFLSGGGAINLVAALFQDTTANALAVTGTSIPGVDEWESLNLSYEMAAGTTSATTFKLRAGPTSGTMYVNGNSTVRKFGGIVAVRIRVSEIKV